MTLARSASGINKKLVEIDTVSGGIVPGHSVEIPGDFRVDDFRTAAALDPARQRILLRNAYNSILQLPIDFSQGLSRWVTLEPSYVPLSGFAVGFDPADPAQGEAVLLTIPEGTLPVGIAVSDLRAPPGAGPIHTMRGPSMGLQLYPRDTNVDPGLAVDHVHGEIFVVQPSAVFVYPLNQDGDVPPLRRLTGANTLQHPTGLALDLMHDELIVADGATGDILTFPRDAAGDVPPLRRISPGSRTYLRDSIDLLFDATSANLLVANGSGLEIAEFVSNGGETAPVLVDKLDLDFISLESIALDADHLSMAASTVYASYGRVCPRSAINSGDFGGCVFSRPLFQPLLRVLSHGDEQLWLSSGEVNVLDSRLSWPPLRSLGGLQSARDIAVDDLHGELLVLEARGVLAFSSAANGEAEPLRRLQVPDDARRLLVDTKRERINVLTPSGVLSYSRTAVDGAHPLGSLQGPKSSLSGATAFTLCSLSPP
jgi:hypothetical protein